MKSFKTLTFKYFQ